MSWQVVGTPFVEFKVKKLWGLIKVRGQMAVRNIVLDLDGANPESWSVYAEIDSASVSTGNARRDKHLLTADFFDFARYPLINFRSNGVTQTDENSFKVTGELTIKDVTRQVDLVVTRGSETTAGSIRFMSNTMLRRNDFGLNFNRIPIGPEAEVSLELQALRRVNDPVSSLTQ
jgi:polyisoprenoid-binding protein YceI